MSNKTKTTETAGNFTANGHKRAVLYARVSTDDQAEKGYSLPSQAEACREYAKLQDFEIVGEFSDDYSGATPIESRPEGSKAYAMLASGVADVLIAYRIDRIVRPPEEGDEWDMPILIRGLAKLGKEIHTVNRGKLGTSFADLLIAMLDAKGAGDERRNIMERTRRGRMKKAKSGKVVGLGGKAPYGYRYAAGQLIIIETEAEVVGNIYRWYVMGDGNGNGPLAGTAIAKRLSEMGIPTPGEAHDYPRRRGTAMWGAPTIYKILDNETNAGIWRFGKTQGHGRERTTRPMEETIIVSVPPIIDADTFHAAKERRKYNRMMSKRNVKREYLLRGMVECGCGYRMVGQSAHGKNLYYQCKAKNMRHVGLEPRKCYEKAVRCDLLDLTAWNYLLDVMTDADGLEEKLHEAQRLEQESKQPKRDELALVLEYIKETEAEADEIALALRKAQGRVADSLQRQQDDVNTRYDKLCHKRDDLQADIDARNITDEDITNTLQFQRDVADGLRKPTFEDKRYYLEMLRFHAVIKNHKATMTCYLNTGGCTIDLCVST